MNQKENSVSHKETSILIISVFIAGLCSIIYELLIGTASSYFLGDSVRQFSITIGCYMAAMGIGSFASRLIRKNLISKFIAVEIILGFLGGISIPALYFCYAYTDAYTAFMVIFILAIGILIGLEIPLLTRIMGRYYTLKINISNVLSIDYLGALIATLLFPFLLLPFWGTFKSFLFFGIINMGIGFINLWCFKEKMQISRVRFYTVASTGVCLFLAVMFFSSQFLLKGWSNSVYEDRIIFSRQTRYQKIVLTRHKNDIRMFLDGNLQFSTIDEYRYHEALVHIPFSVAPNRKKILILGGGDGLAVREILKYPGIETIYLVDIDPEVIRVSTENRFLREINKGSLKDDRVTIINRDAFIYVKDTTDLFDVIISDLPDPNNISLSRLYSREFYGLIASRLSKTGIFVTQATSPFFSNKAFWCINNTIEAAGLVTHPYHVYVPSLGDWGFVMASKIDLNFDSVTLMVPTRYLDETVINALLVFEKDLIDKTPDISTLDKPAVLSYYLSGWENWH